jgi:nucleoside-diphosphate-sugar epimerase
MPDGNGRPSVAVVGAAGFVGRALLNALEAIDLRATAVVRGAPELAVHGSFHEVLSQPVSPSQAGFDVVVNLAYPTSGRGFEHSDQNLQIADTVRRLACERGRVIQVSTQAVFGLALDRPVVLGPIAKTRDHGYVESKIQAEQLFVEQQQERSLSLDIVRLGNVWGYASGTWAVPVVQRLATGRPICVAGAKGYSNTTDVINTASYLSFLVVDGERAPGVRHHHLAEFSSVTWPDWVHPIAEAMKVEPVYARRGAVEGPKSGVREIAGALAPLGPRRVYQQLAQERISGSWSRTLVRRVPLAARPRLKSSDTVVASEPPYSRADQSFLAIMAGEQEFRSEVDPRWTGALGREQSLEGVLRWLSRG